MLALTRDIVNLVRVVAAAAATVAPSLCHCDECGRSFARADGWSERSTATNKWKRRGKGKGKAKDREKKLFLPPSSSPLLLRSSFKPSSIATAADCLTLLGCMVKMHCQASITE